MESKWRQRVGQWESPKELDNQSQEEHTDGRWAKIGSLEELRQKQRGLSKENMETQSRGEILFMDLRVIPKLVNSLGQAKH